MAEKKAVEEITSMDVDFAKWYTDICRKAELIEYTSVKGCMVLRPYGCQRLRARGGMGDIRRQRKA